MGQFWDLIILTLGAKGWGGSQGQFGLAGPYFGTSRKEGPKVFYLLLP